MGRTSTNALRFKPMKGSNQTTVRNHNERLVLHLIRRHGALTKAEATRVMGLSPTAISMIFKALEKDGFLLRDDPLRGRVGQPSVPLRLNADARYYLGLKIGRRSLDIVVVDFCGAVRARRTRVHDYPTPASVNSFINRELPELLEAANLKKSQISGSGIAIPTALWEWIDDFDASKQDMEAWREFDADTYLGEALPGPIAVENDGTAACRAEWVFGKQSNHPDSIYFFLGTFIGGGVVLNGSVFKGCFGNAGGFGPLRVPDEPGGTRLIDHASLMTLERMLISNDKSVQASKFLDADWSGFEPILTDWIARASRSLAHAIVSAASVIDFQFVILDGPFPEDIRNRFCKQVEVQLDQLDQQGILRPNIVPGSFGGVARAVGAAALHITSHYMIETGIIKDANS